MRKFSNDGNVSANGPGRREKSALTLILKENVIIYNFDVVYIFLECARQWNCFEIL